MTCKQDCIHYLACKSLLESQGYAVDGDGKDAGKLCNEFENKKDFEKVIRCKNCKHRSKYDRHWCAYWMAGVSSVGFCNHGERKTK